MIDDELELAAAIETDITEVIEHPGRKLRLSGPVSQERRSRLADAHRDREMAAGQAEWQAEWQAARRKRYDSRARYD